MFTNLKRFCEFTFRKFNVIYICLAPRAEPEAKNRVWGGASARQRDLIIYTIVKTLAKAAMSVPDGSMRLFSDGRACVCFVRRGRGESFKLLRGCRESPVNLKGPRPRWTSKAGAP